MQMQIAIALLEVCLSSCLIQAKIASKYLPPNYAGSGGGQAARPSNQYLAPHSSPHYHGVSESAHSGHGASGVSHFASAASGPAASRYGHNSAAAQIPILRNDYKNDGRGNYEFGFKTGNGIERDETGTFQGGWPGGSQNVKGSYSYTGDDGHTYTVNYKADASGFHAQGDHLPTPPPIPKEIQDSLALHSHGGSSGGFGGSGGGRYGGHSSHGGHVSAASAHAPSQKYLPPQKRAYHFARRQY